MRGLVLLRAIDQTLAQNAHNRARALRQLGEVGRLDSEDLWRGEANVERRLRILRDCRAELDRDPGLDAVAHELLADSFDQTIDVVELLQAEVIAALRRHQGRENAGAQFRAALGAWWSTPAGIGTAELIQRNEVTLG